DLFAGVNTRVLEHFQRLRYARRHYPLLHPFTNAQRNAAERATNAEIRPGERQEYLDCEATEAVTTGSVMDMRDTVTPGTRREGSPRSGIHEGLGKRIREWRLCAAAVGFRGVGYGGCTNWVQPRYGSR